MARIRNFEVISDKFHVSRIVYEELCQLGYNSVIQRTAQHYITEGRNLRNRRCENINSYKITFK
jgi:hypothetical protein